MVNLSRRSQNRELIAMLNMAKIKLLISSISQDPLQESSSETTGSMGRG